MKKVSMDTWIQLLGMLGVIASLVFVGLQMRQSQQIALAAQQTERMQVFTDIVNTFTESGLQYEALNLNGEERVSSDSFNLAINVVHQALWVFENDFLQYSLGLMDESIWQAKSNFLLSSFSTCIGRQVFNQRKDSLDTRIVELIDAAPAQSCDEASTPARKANNETETMVYFTCYGYETRNFVTNVTDGFNAKESFVVDKMAETLSFLHLGVLNYEKPIENYIFATKELLGNRYSVKFDIVTGELAYSLSKGELDRFGNPPLLSEWKYLCEKSDTLI